MNLYEPGNAVRHRWRLEQIKLSVHEYLHHVENRFNTDESQQTIVKTSHITSFKKANPNYPNYLEICGVARRGALDFMTSIGGER